MATKGAIDREALRANATTQHHNVTFGQLKEAGYSARQILAMRRREALVETAPGVYRSQLAGAPDWKATTAAATLAYGANACGLSSAAIHGVLPPPDNPDVVARRGRHAPKDGLCRSSAHLEADDLVVVDGIACTSPARTCIDIAEWHHALLARQVVESMLVRKLVTYRELAVQAFRLRRVRRHGAVVVRSILATIYPDLDRARNEWEALLVNVIVEYLGVQPVLNHRVEIGGRTYELDAALVEWCIAVEYDGFDPHGTRTSFDRDHVRRNDIAGGGWPYFAVTASSLCNGPERAMRNVAAAIRRRAGRLPKHARLHDPTLDAASKPPPSVPAVADAEGVRIVTASR